MAKKTRKKKFNVNYLHLEKIYNTESKEKHQEQPHTIPKTTEKIQKKQLIATNIAYKDLKKTIILTIFILSIEFTLFWLLERNGFEYVRTVFVQ